MRHLATRFLLTGLLIALIGAPAFAQGGVTSSIAGVVDDTSGGTIPGATVVVKNDATGATYNAVTSQNGTFAIGAVPPGTYTVTVSLTGFKTTVLTGVVVRAGVPGDVRATLEVGGLEEVVEVQGRGEIVQTQSSAMSTTIDVNQISNLPLISRSALDFVVNLPGVNTPAGNRNSTVNGLPQSAINITIDGMSVQDNHLKTGDGFFARITPRLDAVDEVTVTSAAQGADAAGQGAVQIRFVTRSGGNSFAGSVYHYFRSDALNANTWFNERDGLAKPELLQNQPGFRAGGPIRIPGVYDGRGQMFYFFNYEEFRQPQTIRRNRTILTPEAQAGVFSYNTSSGVRSVNLLELAAANGHVPTLDPTVAQLLADIRSSTSGTGSITDLEDPVLQRFSWNVDQRAQNKYPTGKFDYNVSSNHRVTASGNWHHINSNPDTLNGRDPQFPGMAVQGTQDSYRYSVYGSLRSTLWGTVVNEFKVGGTGGATYFANEIGAPMWSNSFGNEAGFKLGISAANISNPSSGSATSSREASTKVVENTVNWVKGSHSFNFGGAFTQADVWLFNQTHVPSLTFDVATSDPAKGMFNTTNFPGSSSGQRGDAEDLYAVLVGRVTQVSANARLDPATAEYVYLGPSLQEGRLREFGFWLQDAWRPRPDLTLNLGLRYELQLPFYSLNDSYTTPMVEDVWGVSGLASTCTNLSEINPADCNLFRPGLTPGKSPELFPFNANTRAYAIDKNNWAPSVGLAWTPTAETGWLAGFLGQPGDTVFRAGFARSFNRPGMSDFTGQLDDNPGIAITTNRSEGLDNFGPFPVLMRNGDLGPADFPATREFPMTQVVTGAINVFDPNLQVPYADTWSAGYQRAVSRNIAMEIRYVGTRSRDGWTTYDINELNIHENGFLTEFLAAQQNLQANIAAGRGNNFRYFGPGTGTSPLPTYLAYFSGLPSATAEDPARYGSSLFANSTFVNHLAIRDPNPFSAVSALDSTADRRANALAAGLPANFIVANPEVLGGARFRGHGGYTRYNSMQFEVRRRMASGFQFQANYTYGTALGSSRFSFRVPRELRMSTGGEGGVTHAVKANWLFELPIGQGRRFASNAGPVLDRIIGGWQIHGVTRLQSGQLVNFGNVRMVGFDRNDLRDMYFHRIDAAGRVTMLPEDVIENTVRAFSADATSATGYSDLGVPEGRFFAPANGPDCIETIDNALGDCGEGEIVVSSPMLKLLDISVVKHVPITGRVRAEFRIEMLNAFNWVNYSPVTGLGDDPTDYEVTGLTGTPTSRIIQLVSRVTW